ncbi:hypothetical protein E2562_038579 [Oryza meyeriana var. granulata]|uniref:Uncharacterized protein n=1 Tax=Oryza meyeriana var. granulata TaxID=110450 RepID=A0A6G1DTL6_9ORYZ|nr:hypothetical protein E2562_038579 [Oryza meyeriana var. granulata]
MFVFVAGIIKYGERIWALKYGSRNDLNSTSTQYENDELPPLSIARERFADHKAKLKIIEMELGMIYDDLFTKASLVRRRMHNR